MWRPCVIPYLGTLPGSDKGEVKESRPEERISTTTTHENPDNGVGSRIFFRIYTDTNPTRRSVVFFFGRLPMYGTSFFGVLTPDVLSYYTFRIWDRNGPYDWWSD